MIIFAAMKKSLPLIILIIALLAGGCSKYQKLLKSTDYELKYAKAVEYFNEEEYNRALPILEELMTVFRGSDKGEDVYYYYARTYFGNEDYILAGYHLKYFVRTYPNSKHAEECLFLCALSYYLDSPKYTLDQTNTQIAIQEFQLFANQFPVSNLIDSCNSYIDKLRFKIETKAFENARLYYKTGFYKSSILGFDNTLRDFPNSVYREDMVFLVAKSHFLLAENSIDFKKAGRYRNAMEAFARYLEEYPTGKYAKEARTLSAKSNSMLGKNS